MSFRGTYSYAMDARGRVPLPPRYRDLFADGVVLSQGSPNKCIRVYTMEAYERLSAQYTAQPAMRQNGQVLRHALFPGSHDAELDGQHRILVPGYLRDYAGLGTKVTVVGTGEVLEIWDPEEYAAFLERIAPMLPGALESIES